MCIPVAGVDLNIAVNAERSRLVLGRESVELASKGVGTVVR